MISQPEPQDGTPNLGDCYACNSAEWKAVKTVEETRRLDYGLGVWEQRWKVTTWQCANPKCERKAMQQTEQMVGYS